MAARTDGYDVIVVGAGSAGCVLAARLSEDPARRIALVEAGGPATDPRIHDPLQWPFLAGGPDDWDYRTTPQPGTAGRAHAWPRGRVVGGSSCLNAMAHVRGHPRDFDPWAAAGGPGWSFDSLLPFFLRSERFSGGASAWHGGDGPLDVYLPEVLHPVAEAFLAAGEQLGLAPSGDHNGPRLAGPARNSLTIRDGRRVTVADAYLTAGVLARRNLTLVTDVEVERVLLAPGPVARGVEGRRDRGSWRAEAPLVVLAAGAIGSPLLLLRSGIGPAAQLRRHGLAAAVDLAAVGEGLQDHLLGAGNVYASRETLPPSRLQHSESLLYALRGPGAVPDVVVACAVLPVTSDAFVPPAPGEGFTLLFGVTHPQSRGRLRLGGPGLDDAPVIDPAYLSADGDRRGFREALALARELGATQALEPYRGAELLPGPDVDLRDRHAVDDFIARAAITHHHPVGTCALGAVVDGELRVRGVEGLRVADASVIPSLPTGPVHAAVLALAERGAELLQRP